MVTPLASSESPDHALLDCDAVPHHRRLERLHRLADIDHAELGEQRRHRRVVRCPVCDRSPLVTLFLDPLAAAASAASARSSDPEGPIVRAVAERPQCVADRSRQGSAVDADRSGLVQDAPGEPRATQERGRRLGSAAVDLVIQGGEHLGPRRPHRPGPHGPQQQPGCQRVHGGAGASRGAGLACLATARSAPR